LCEGSVDFGVKDDNGRTAARTAASYGSEACLDFIKQQHYDFAADVDEEGNSLLMEAHPICIGKLIEAGVLVNKQNDDGLTAVHSVNSFCQYKAETLRTLIAQGASVNIASKNGTLPTHLAARSGDIECLCCLLCEDVNIDAEDNAGRTPVQIAVANNNGECADFLLRCGARDDEQKSCAKWVNNFNLQVAVAQKDVERARDLLTAGAESNGRMNEPLMHLAASTGCEQMLRLLFEFEVNINTCYHRKSPLSEAMAKEHSECVDFLLQAGASDPEDKAKKWLAAYVEDELDYWGSCNF